jgi:hypothetical protein
MKETHNLCSTNLKKKSLSSCMNLQKWKPPKWRQILLEPTPSLLMSSMLNDISIPEEKQQVKATQLQEKIHQLEV